MLFSYRTCISPPPLFFIIKSYERLSVFLDVLFPFFSLSSMLYLLSSQPQYGHCSQTTQKWTEIFSRSFSCPMILCPRHDQDLLTNIPLKHIENFVALYEQNQSLDLLFHKIYSLNLHFHISED